MEDPVFVWIVGGIVTLLVAGGIAAGVRSWMQARRYRRQAGP